MDTQVVVKEGLSTEMISAGKELVHQLDKIKFVINKEISGIRFSHNVIHGTLIEDAYIYRILQGPKHSVAKNNRAIA